MGTNVVVQQGKHNAKGKEALHILYWKRGRGGNEGSGVGDLLHCFPVMLGADFFCPGMSSGIKK